MQQEAARVRPKRISLEELAELLCKAKRLPSGIWVPEDSELVVESEEDAQPSGS